MANDKKSDRDVQAEAVAQAEAAAQAETSRPITRDFKVACNVQHDGVLYVPGGDPIPCDEALFNELVAAGAIKRPKRADD